MCPLVCVYVCSRMYLRIFMALWADSFNPSFNFQFSLGFYSICLSVTVYCILYLCSVLALELLHDTKNLAIPTRQSLPFFLGPAHAVYEANYPCQITSHKHTDSGDKDTCYCLASGHSLSIRTLLLAGRRSMTGKHSPRTSHCAVVAALQT